MIEKEGKFLRYSGHLYAARVVVQVEDADDAVIETQCIGEGWVRQGDLEEASQYGYGDWKMGAVAGAVFATNVLKSKNRIKIIKIIGLTTDTTPAAVGAATIYAIWEAVGYKTQKHEIEYIEKVVFNSKNQVPVF